MAEEGSAALHSLRNQPASNRCPRLLEFIFHMADAPEYDSDSSKGTLGLAGQPSSPLVVTSKKAVALHCTVILPYAGSRATNSDLSNQLRKVATPRAVD